MEVCQILAKVDQVPGRNHTGGLITGHITVTNVRRTATRTSTFTVLR
jgi:hypothetical protein